MSSVMVGMSGGVDSSVAAALLQRQGHRVAGVTMRLWKETGDNTKEVEDAAQVCRSLGIPHFVLDLTEEFYQTVVQDFIMQYRAGKTPNPCIVCNRTMKFGKMLSFALEQGYELISTGHYVECRQENGRYRLLQSENLQKDQSYVLYHLTQEQLSHCIFPLVSYSKDQIRQMARDWELPVAQKPDSQDICFLPKDYAAFLERQSGKMEPGNFIDREGKVIGRHRGIYHYTIGQRKGLGGTFGKPMFVTKITPADNTVTLGEAGEEYCTQLRAGNVNWIDDRVAGAEFQTDVMIRYKSKRYVGIVSPNEDGTVTVTFPEEPPRAVTPGQAAVFYQGRYVLGGGTILE